MNIPGYDNWKLQASPTGSDTSGQYCKYCDESVDYPDQEIGCEDDWEGARYYITFWHVECKEKYERN